MLVDINSIKPNPNNPRTIKDDKFLKLIDSIKEFPEMLELRPIVVNKEMMILGGNMRYKACKEAGLTQVHIQVADLTQEQQDEFLIKDNISGGEWDWIKLSTWDTKKLSDWGMDIWEDTDINLDEFFEPPSDEDEEPLFKVYLEYNEVDVCEFNELIKKHSGSKEEIVLKLLKGL